VNGSLSVVLSLLKATTSPDPRAPGRYDERQILMRDLVWLEVTRPVKKAIQKPL